MVMANVLRRMPQISMKAETFAAEDDLTNETAKPIYSYRPNQDLWNKVTIEKCTEYVVYN